MEDVHFTERVLFTDEAPFIRNGFSITIIVTHGKETIPTSHHPTWTPTSLQCQCLFTIINIIHNEIIWPYILPERLNGNIYRIFPEEVLPDLLTDVYVGIRGRMRLQLDGAPVHFAVDFQFHNRLIG